MAQTFNNGDVDLNRYLDDGPAITKVKPASSFREQLHAKFRARTIVSGGSCPSRKRSIRCACARRLVDLGWINGDGKSALLGQTILGLMGGRRACVYRLARDGARRDAEAHDDAGERAGAPGGCYLDAFSKWTDDKLWIYDHLGTVQWKQMVALARYLHQELGIQHLVIDSFTKCGIAPDDLTSSEAFTDELFAHCKATGMHIHLVCHMRKGRSRATRSGRRSSTCAAPARSPTWPTTCSWWCATAPRRTRSRRSPRSKLQREPDTFLIVEKQRNHSFEGTVGPVVLPDDPSLGGDRPSSRRSRWRSASSACRKRSRGWTSDAGLSRLRRGLQPGARHLPYAGRGHGRGEGARARRHGSRRAGVLLHRGHDPRRLEAARGAGGRLHRAHQLPTPRRPREPRIARVHRRAERPAPAYRAGGNGLPAPREISMCLYAAGVARARVRPRSTSRRCRGCPTTGGSAPRTSSAAAWSTWTRRSRAARPGSSRSRTTSTSLCATGRSSCRGTREPRPHLRAAR
jgi:twinkle protein